jgi:transposase InsO family protein
VPWNAYPWITWSYGDIALVDTEDALLASDAARRACESVPAERPFLMLTNGSQYTSIRYANRLLDAGALASIGSVGDSYDNALAESTIGLYKAECVRHEGPWRGVDDLELGTLSWVHWFNGTRLHGSIGHVPPIEYETEYYRQNTARQQPLPGELALH